MAANQQFCLRWNNHQSTLISVFDTLLESGTLVDCTLAAEGQSLKAHKVVLSACSPYLESLLSQHYEKHPILILKDVTFTELKAMLDYMYRGEVNICQDQLGQFLKAAESLQIKGLTDNSSSNNSNSSCNDLIPPVPRKIETPPRKLVNPYSKSPLFPTGLVVEPRPKVNNNNNSTTTNNNDCSIPNKPGSDGGSSPKRKRRRKSLDDLSSEGLYTSGENIGPECLVKAEPKYEDVNNDVNSGDEIPCDADDEEELDLSRPGTSQSAHNSLQPSWNASAENAADEMFPPGQHDPDGDKGYEWKPHMLDPKPHSCEFCGRTYRYLHNLERHRRMECGKEATLVCPLCPYRSKHKHNLMRHFALRHAPKNDLDSAQPLHSNIRKIDPNLNTNLKEFLSNVSTGKNSKLVPNTKTPNNMSFVNSNAASSSAQSSSQLANVKTEEYPYEYYYPSYQ